MKDSGEHAVDLFASWIRAGVIVAWSAGWLDGHSLHGSIATCGNARVAQDIRYGHMDHGDKSLERYGSWGACA